MRFYLTKRRKELILRSLKDIASGVYEKDLGICSNAEQAIYEHFGDYGLTCADRGPVFGMLERYLRRQFREWEHYSGSPIFPVPDPAYPKSRVAADKIYWRDDKWDKSRAYGALRWNLLEFLITSLEKELSV